MTKKFVIALGLILVVMFLVGQHLIHSADRVARYVGYFMSVGVLPFLFGMCAGLAYLRLMVFPITKESSLKVILILSGFGVVAILPTVYTWLMWMQEGA